MAQIPGGTFKMGRNDGPNEFKPAHDVRVEAFAMDKTEVTNAEYAAFVRETNHRTPEGEGWVNGKVLPEAEKLPVTGISLDDAKAFASWRSKRDGATYRLPTEAEWEYAARNGAKANAFPWGDKWAEKSAVIGVSAPLAVGSMPDGVNEWGVQDLIGNVWEWTDSPLTWYPGSNGDTAKINPKDIIIRGGSCASKIEGEKGVSATLRQWVNNEKRDKLLGFRLVRSGS
jgi:serine/threonine-protein kinase